MFVPLTPDEEKKFIPVCTSNEHNPPSYMVITRPCKWVCPACGATVLINPTQTICAVGDDTPKRYRFYDPTSGMFSDRCDPQQ